VLEACPGQSNTALPEGRAGNSLETIRNMVASGLGISVLPATALTQRHANQLVKAIEFSAPCPARRVALASRRGFHRPAALERLVAAIKGLQLPVKNL